ncbi:hypothetical protein HQ585_20420 [candidate division KSB1 bacterium]|nr:hypothetical protein [candidate division KSB1 bacterium]
MKATPGDGQVILSWDDIADVGTREPFLGGENDFEGYKLYRATDKKFQDAEVITDGFGTPTLMKPIFQCDLKDNKTGFTDFGLLNGMGYYLGDDSGIQHYFIDEDVQNGKTYYYGLAAYDYGIPDSLIEIGIAPSENTIYIELDESENVYFVPQNVQVATPHQMASGYVPPEIEILASNLNPNSGSIAPEIVDRDLIKPGHTYTVKFNIDTVNNMSTSDMALSHTAAGYKMWDVTDSTKLILNENENSYIGNNLIYDNVAFDPDDEKKRWLMPVNIPIISDHVDGLRLNITSDVITSHLAGYDYANSGWAIGDADIVFSVDSSALQFFPWDYELVFTDDSEAYTGKAKRYRPQMNDEQGNAIDEIQILMEEPFSFYMLNKDFLTEEGGPDTLDAVVYDVNQNGVFDILEDKVLFGALDRRDRWLRTVFIVGLGETPMPGDVYYATFHRPFFQSDSLTFTVHPEGALNKDAIISSMEDIKVVPNPYVATNSMEPSLANWNLNQKRRLLFTHLPARCTIKIFTSSGVFVDEIVVENGTADGIAHWDLLSDEGLDIAAGIYIYHVQAHEVDAEKIGKFAVIK